MRLSEQWLREWVSPRLSTEAIAARFTMAGIEVGANGVLVVLPDPARVRKLHGTKLAAQAHAD